MTLAERITAARAALVSTKDALTALATKDDLTPEEIARMEELTAQAEKQANDLAVLERTEKALALHAHPVTPGEPAPATTPATTPAARAAAPAVIAARPRVRNAVDVLIRSAVVALERNVTSEAPESIIARRYPGAMEVEETYRLLTGNQVTRAATPPAMTNVAGWAQELVREGYGAFMEALEPMSVVPRLPLDRFEFDGFAKITIPARANTYPDEPNLAAAFRAEGAPIRVGRTTLSSQYLTPKSMGVIGTFTKELLRRSTPNIEDAIRRWMLNDTARMLDAAFLSAFAGNALRPAGLQAGIAAGDTAASGGNTGTDILNDLKGRLQAMSAKGLGSSPVWVMNTKHVFGVQMATTPTGDRQFPDAANGTLGGIPVVASRNVPIGIVFLIDAAEVAFAGGAPVFEGSDVATIHEESGDPNTDEITGATVKPIVDGAGVVAAPVRSLFQTNSAALKALWELDWKVLRAGAVQTITGVGW